MALSLTLPTSRGISCNYWRIAGRPLSIDERAKVMTVALYGFVDVDHADGEPIDTRVITLEGENFVEVEDRVAVKDSRDWLYSAIKSMKTTNEKDEAIDGEFSDATEV